MLSCRLESLHHNYAPLRIDVYIPGLLRDCTGGHPRVALDADTLGGAITTLLRSHPLLRVHLYDESERLRPHVLIFHNDENIKRLERLDVPLRAGDRLHIVQAVSGG